MFRGAVSDVRCFGVRIRCAVRGAQVFMCGVLVYASAWFSMAGVRYSMYSAVLDLSDVQCAVLKFRRVVFGVQCATLGDAV